MRDTRSTPGPAAHEFTALWDLYAGRILAYARRHVDADTAEEVVAETFLVAWRRLEDVPGAALPWLLVVARNTIANQRRSRYRVRLLTHEMARLAHLAPASASAETTALERGAALRALAALTAREREALLLVTWDGLTPADAATVLGCSVSAFTMRLSRARTRFRDVATSPPDTPRSPRRPVADLADLVLLDPQNG